MGGSTVRKSERGERERERGEGRERGKEKVKKKRERCTLEPAAAFTLDY